MTSLIDDEVDILKTYLGKQITAKLTPDVENNLDSFDFNPPIDYFEDDKDPRRTRFNPNLDYNQTVDDDGNIVFADLEVQKLHRNWQIANQMHRCCHTCWKYVNSIVAAATVVGVILCRFFYPWAGPPITSSSRVNICHDRDKKNRTRVRAFPPRDNANLNVHSVHGRLNLAHNANLDVQFISNTAGAAEYSCSYSGKSDEADMKKIKNIVFRTFSKQLTQMDSVSHKDQLRTVANAVNSCSKVGTVQACYFLLGLPIVISSRTVESINPLHRSKVNVCVKKDIGNNDEIGNSARNDGIDTNEALEDEHEADKTDDEIVNYANYNSSVGDNLTKRSAFLSDSIGTTLGKRDFYGKLMRQQLYLIQTMNQAIDIRHCITLFSLLSSFTMKAHDPKRKGVLNSPPILKLDENGFVIESQLLAYKIDDIVMIPRRKKCVLNMSPCIPVDSNSERSAYATLLLHTAWANEATITAPYESAVEKLKDLIDNQLLPSRVSVQSDKRRRSEKLLSNQGPVHIQSVENDVGDVPVDWIYENPDDVVYSAPEAPNFLLDKQTLTQNNFLFYSNFISSQIRVFNDKRAIANQIDPDNDMDFSGSNKEGGCRVPDWEARKSTLSKNLLELNKLQKVAYDHVDEQLNSGGFSLSFISGEGGVGKSHVLRLIQENCALKFGKTKGIYGSSLALGPTGNASHNVGGYTWQSALGRGLKDCEMTSTMASKVGFRIEGLKCLLLEEISMMSPIDLWDIETRIKKGITYYFKL